MMNENEEEAEKADVFRVYGKRIMIIIAVVILVIIALLGVVGWSVSNPVKSRYSDADQEETFVEMEKENVQIDAMGTAVSSALAEIVAEVGQDIEGEEYAAPQKTAEAVKLSDIYTVSGNMIQLECYYPGAESYVWEVYNRHTCAWETVDSESRQDELYRPVSVMYVAAEGTDTTSVRCTVGMEDGETITENASVYIIPDIQDISMKESYVTDAGKYISSREIPIQVSYVNGTQNVITGLYGATFVESTEKRELSSNGAGNPIETITTVCTECNYAYVGLEDKEVLLRYRCGEQVLDTGMTISGKDLCAPVISDVDVSFEITNMDAPVTANISITAEDDKTPYPDLEYAFIPKDTDAGDDVPVPDDADWTQKAAFDLDITQNGTWIAFCRDQSGNMASMEKEIIVVDQKAPVMSVRLADTEWCSSTKLVVDAEDYLPVEYRVISPTGTDSGWTTQSEHEVNCNGTWEVQARDSVGNVSTESITVSNIDRQGPVIEKITAEKVIPAEGGSNNNED